MFHWAQSFDDWVLAFVQAHMQQPWLQYVCRDITSLGGDTLTTLIAIFVTGALWLTSQRKQTLLFCGTMLATATSIVCLKLLVGRPCPLQPDPYQHLMTGGDFPTGVLSLHLPCMPSGHTMGSCVLYGLLMFMARDMLPQTSVEGVTIYLGHLDGFRYWLTGWLIALPIAIGVTRIILSAHWASDVLVAYALAWVILLSSRWVFGRMEAWNGHS